MSALPPSIVPLADESLPALFRSGDHASRNAQRVFSWLSGASLALVCLAALAASIRIGPQHAPLPVIVGALLVALALTCTVIVNLARPDKGWYGGRAAAESVRTLAWKYMTGTEPFEPSLADAEVDKRFAGALEAILADRRQLSWNPPTSHADEPQITDDMRRIRRLCWQNRRETYLAQRVRSQRSWYTSKALKNGQARIGWFVLTVLAELATLIAVVTLARGQANGTNLTGFFSALAAACIGWMSLKQHSELAQAYELTAHEIGLVELQGAHVTGEAELSKFVSDAENAMSREHTLWVARRDQMLR